MKRNVLIYQTPAELAAAASELIAETILQAVRERGACSLALAGGNTPRAVYESLAGERYRQKIPWRQIHFFWGDERMVPPDHVLSNFRMASEAILRHIEVPAGNIHRMKGELAPEEAAHAYREELQLYSESNATIINPPSSIFDLVLLGLGEDGHTASLFPKTHAVFETRQTATAVFVPNINQWRVTLTLPVINQARKVVFLIAGKSKGLIVSSILNLERGDARWPASLVQPAHGELHWLLDAEAASLLRSR